MKRTVAHSTGITGGTLKGRKITLPAQGTARYTSSKVRGAIFNLIGNPEGLSVLDLFSGAGSFAIESLSRGAATATCVEISRQMYNLLVRNLANLSLDNMSKVLHMDVSVAIPFLSKQSAIYDIIFMDPPYERGHIGATLQILENHVIYGTDTLLVIEHSKREQIDMTELHQWTELKHKQYGDTVVSVFTTSNPNYKEH